MHAMSMLDVGCLMSKCDVVCVNSANVFILGKGCCQPDRNDSHPTALGKYVVIDADGQKNERC